MQQQFTFGGGGRVPAAVSAMLFSDTSAFVSTSAATSATGDMRLPATLETCGLYWQCGLQLQRQRGFSKSGAAAAAALRQLALLVLCRCGSVQLQRFAAFSWRF
jgi:hypothetical protein